MSKKLDDAIAAILAAAQPQGCWASRLNGEAKELVLRLKEEEAKGNKPNRVAVVKVLYAAFDVKTSEEGVRKHLNGTCSCA
jgi:hypothetical protein